METEYHHQLYQNPAKSPLKPKKAPVITRGAYSKVRVGNMEQKRFVVDWGGRQRQRRQKNKLVYSEMFVSYNGRRAVTVQRIGQKYGKPALWIVTVPVSVQPC